MTQLQLLPCLRISEDVWITLLLLDLTWKSLSNEVLTECLIECGWYCCLLSSKVRSVSLL
jgi:hypothetical protein